MAVGTGVPHLQSWLPVCCSKVPEPLKSIRPLAICCSRGTSTAVSQERDCRSPGSSSSAMSLWEAEKTERGRAVGMALWMGRGPAATARVTP